MALHTTLEIHRTVFDLLGEAAEIVRQMRRDIKGVLGNSIVEACTQLDIHIMRANMAQEKEPHLLVVLEQLQTIQLKTRVCRDRGWMPRKHYSRLAELTESIGRQCNGWRTKMKELGGEQQGQLFGSQGSQTSA